MHEEKDLGNLKSEMRSGNREGRRKAFADMRRPLKRKLTLRATI